MVTKQEVRTWVAKCKAKALASVVAEHNVELEKMVLANKDLKVMHEIGTAHTAITKTYQELFKSNACPNVIVQSYVNGYMYNGLYGNGGGPLHAVGYIISKNEAKFPKESAIVASAVQKYNDVANEYSALSSRCDALKPKAAVDYLISLKFDVSSLIQAPAAIDTSKLFVCGDNKPG